MKLKILVLILVVTFSINSYAFKFSPMSATISTEEKKNSTLFYLENDSNQAIAVTASVFKREMDKNGIENNTPVGEELSIYPTQLIIPPNEKRSVKVTWVSKESLKSESAYRFIAEQLPIDIEKTQSKKASIKVLLRYVAALYVSSDEFTSELILQKIVKKEKDLFFYFKNTGKKHQVLANLSMKIDGSKKIDLSQEDLKGISGENILALSERIFKIPIHGKLNDFNPTDKVKLNFEKD